MKSLNLKEKMKVLFFSTRDFEKPFIERYAKESNIEYTCTEAKLDEISAKMSGGYDAVACFTGDSGNSVVLEELSAQGVQCILLRSAGYNHIDLDKAKELNIAVARVPAYSPYAIAEHTVAMMMTLNRKIIQANNRVKTLNFSLSGLMGFDMHGKTVGIIGTGKIGEKLAFILNGFGCNILAYDLEENPEVINKTNAKYVSLEELLKQSDVISLHVPLNEHTHYILNRENMQLMKEGVMLINTSRGGLLETKAVIDLLKSRKIGYLGLDVYEEEEGLFFEDHSMDILQDDVIARLMTFPNVLITSHQAFLTTNALDGIESTTFQNAKDFVSQNWTENFLVSRD
jgi:D-lactate dehydrogenase